MKRMKKDARNRRKKREKDNLAEATRLGDKFVLSANSS